MAKVVVDASTCVGCGLCEQLCPEVFKLDSDGVASTIFLKLLISVQWMQSRLNEI